MKFLKKAKYNRNKTINNGLRIGSVFIARGRGLLSREYTVDRFGPFSRVYPVETVLTEGGLPLSNWYFILGGDEIEFEGRLI